LRMPGPQQAASEHKIREMEEERAGGAPGDVGEEPNMVEVYGFVGWVLTMGAYVAFLLWSFLPEEVLRGVGVTYYPSRWWAVALPAWLVVSALCVLVGYVGLNLLRTPELSSLDNLTDTMARRLPGAAQWRDMSSEGTPGFSDMPLAVVNRLLFPPPGYATTADGHVVPRALAATWARRERYAGALHRSESAGRLLERAHVDGGSSVPPAGVGGVLSGVSAAAVSEARGEDATDSAVPASRPLPHGASYIPFAPYAHSHSSQGSAAAVGGSPIRPPTVRIPLGGAVGGGVVSFDNDPQSPLSVSTPAPFWGGLRSRHRAAGGAGGALARQRLAEVGAAGAAGAEVGRRRTTTTGADAALGRTGGAGVLGAGVAGGRVVGVGEDGAEDGGVASGSDGEQVGDGGDGALGGGIPGARGGGVAFAVGDVVPPDLVSSGQGKGTETAATEDGARFTIPARRLRARSLDVTFDQDAALFVGRAPPRPQPATFQRAPSPEARGPRFRGRRPSALAAARTLQTTIHDQEEDGGNGGGAKRSRARTEPMNF
jgi:phosphatidylinositol N-acetylglucosaminyltransferase subunit P